MSEGRTIGLRDRRRAETVAEIKAAALEQLATTGPDGLSLRAVARAVGVSVQALYHYFPSRDALVTELVTDTFAELAAAVRAAAADAPSARERSVAAGLAYRSWAHAHRSAFLLALGVPLPDYRAPEDGPTTAAASDLGSAFAAAIFDGLSARELAAFPQPSGVLGDRFTDAGAALGLPPGALFVLTTGWARLHGFVLLELLGHMPWIGDTGEDACRLLLEVYADEVSRR